ncbi:class I ribonucleotide reductase maintenance protein YfaE [Aeromonas dhakensis]|uniref:class I ribonucleotide reductase maintenance protein YfaE n=1 Tax=Aeromonas dhakensis TaxID=196024 RepID=UPI002447CDB3|nr:class I ribonucleotide reductase maintenance protein YfaE [Aeromonas dhakensis]MDH0348534.1 class I ribonucleotide reductase maintenance protein YfaE [Aeromonas dhakensis]
MSDATGTLTEPLHTASAKSETGAPQVHTRDGVLHAHPGESVLETLERHGHHVEFQCRSGYCGACRTPLLAGKVHYAAVPLAFVSQGECLPCCCKPVGAIRLDIKKG